MGSVVDRGNGKYEIIYGGLESPFAGVDASKSNGIFIQPNALQKSQNYCSIDGYLAAQLILEQASAVLANLPGSFYLVGNNLAISEASNSPAITSKSISYVIYTSVNGETLYIDEWTGPVGGVTFDALSINLQTAVPGAVATTLVSYTVNGIVYITGLGLGAIYAYTPLGNGSSTLTVLTSYLGAAYLGELNGRLVALAVQQYTAGSPGTWAYYPYQIAWSAAAGNYSQWNPLVGGLVTGAGFNNLPDVEDTLVGFITTGPTGYAIRTQGITELSPLNSGTLPFDFNHLWASQKGIGSVYPNSICQYGSMGAFLSDTGIYTLGYDGVNQIQGQYWDAIVAQLGALTNANPMPTATLGPVTVGNNTFLAYVLWINSGGGNVQTLNVCNVVNKTWNTVTFESILIPVLTPLSATSFINNSNNLASLVTVALLNTATKALTLNNISDINLPTSVVNNTLVFPVEQVAMFKDVTVNAIGIYSDGNNGTLSPFINGVAFTPVTPAGPGLYMSYPLTGGFCGKNPQLTIAATFTGVNSYSKLYQISLFTSVDMTQVP